MKLRIEQTSIALLSFCVLFLELLETRLLSFVFWNHMVYLCLSVALLGFGISGTLVATFNEKLASKKSTMSWLIAGFALTSSLIFFATILLPIFGWRSSPAKVLFCYTAYSLPFIFAGGAISLILSDTKFKVGQLYAIDLISAGAACFLFFFLLPAFGPQLLIAAIAIALTVVAYFWAPKNKAVMVGCAFNIAAAVAVLFAPSTAIQPEPYKELFGLLQTPGTKIEQTIWTPICRVDVATNEAASFGMHTYHLPQGCAKGITQDGTANTVLPGAKAIEAVLKQLKDDTPTIYAPALVYRFKHQPKVAVIGVGGGIEVLHAYGYGARQITGAELNPAIYQMTTGKYADFTGHFFEKPQIRIVNQEARSMFRHLDEKFDVIQFVAIDTFAALSNGAYVLSENYLYTVEAMTELLDHLEPNGVISCLRWHMMPPRESLRVTSLACEALKRKGCQTIDKQIVVVQQDRWALTLIKNAPFTPDEVNAILTGAKRHGMEVIYLPKVFGAEQKSIESAYYKPMAADRVSASKIWNDLIGSYQIGTESTFFANYAFLVTPTTDDRPFFFEYHQKSELGDLNLDEQRGNNAGMTLNAVMMQGLLFTLFAIVLPLLKFRRHGMAVPDALSYTVYFASIGFGFMLIEVALIQKCVLFLGNPIYSLSVVLATLLISAGVGSFLVTATGWPTRKVLLIFGSLFLAFFVILVFTINPLIYSLMHLPLELRMLTTVCMIGPSGLLLGVFFPTGLKAVRNRAPSYLPWAWGINGCTSVYGSFAAICLAISVGFTNTLLIGAASYLLAFIAGARFGRNELQTAPADLSKLAAEQNDKNDIGLPGPPAP